MATAAESPEASEVRFRRLFRELPMGMFRSTTDGRFLEVNPPLATLLGFGTPQCMVEEINQVGIAQAIFENPAQRMDMLDRLRASSGEWHVEEVRYLRRDRTPIDLLLSISLQRDPDTGEEQLFGFVQDLTEPKRLESERRRRDQLMALGMLAGGIVHDFNNLACGIRGYTQLMVEEEDPAELRILAQRLDAITSRTVDLTSSLLRFARQGSDKPVRYSAYEAIRVALTLFRSGKGVRLQVHEELPGEGPLLEGYPTQFQNAVLNLCLNAADAIGGRPDGRLAVRGGMGPAEGSDLLPGPLAPGEYFHLEVADNGPGMAPEILSRCLAPFFSTKGELGTGLGLPSVQAAVADHRGAMRIETAPEQGCSVHLYLPAFLG